MTKSQLIEKLARKMTYLPENLVADSSNLILELMINSLIADQRIEIRGFGSFSLHYHQPRSAHNPKTGEKILTTPKRSAHFKPGKELKERVTKARLTIPLKK